VPVWLAFALGGAVWLITAGLFVHLFQRTFGLDEKHWPFFFIAGSPFFLKNFLHTLGHFEIYGCLFALVLLLIPARSLFYVANGRTVLDHPRSDPPHPSADVGADHRHHRGAASLPGAGREPAKHGGRHRTARRRWREVPCGAIRRHDGGTGAGIYVLSAQRMAAPSRTDLLSFAHIWYQPLAKQISDTWERLPHNLLGILEFARLIWLHAPLWRYFRDPIAALSVDMHRRIVVAAIIVIGLAYLVMFAMVFDYSRWISNWAVCLFLILHAVKMLPASQDVPLIATDDRNTKVFGWIVTLIPRVGIVRPF
jgi:hypothetical protein